MTLTGSASMGVLGGDWVENRDPATSDVIEGQSEYELHTDIDVTFKMSGQTDTGLTFGATIDLDESDGGEYDGVARGDSPAFGNRTEDGETIFISGGFGTLTMGDTDGALDWALQEIGIGGSLGDVHTTHAGYSGNGIADGQQIARYDYSFGDFDAAVSANISDDASYDDILAVGAKFNASLAAMELGIGLGFTHHGHDTKEDTATGVSFDADFNNGFRAILNWVDMGDDNDSGDDAGEEYIGIGLGYTVDDWTIAANWAQITEDVPNIDEDYEQSGYALVVNYDLGGGAELQLGYSKASCGEFGSVRTNDDCDGGTVDGDRISLGVAMSF